MKNLLPHKTIVYIGALAGLLLTACQDSDSLTGGSDVAVEKMIHIGGVDTDGLVATAVTRSEVDEENVQLTDAENISWLVTPLKDGLDITYGKDGNPRTNERVAILKLLTNESDGLIKYSEDPVTHDKVAEYSFLYRDNDNGNPTNNPAIWYDNGAHYFEGLYIPTRIKYRNEAYDSSPAQTITDVYGTGGSAPNLTTDQHDDNTTESTLGNYTLLSRYLGMPSNFTLNATVARIKLPFRHRLARVLAYILIDPDMGEGVTIEGYKKDAANNPTTTEDATTSKIRFCNVNVLGGVKDSYNSTTQHHTYTPQWMHVRKVVPHYVGERGSYDDSKNQSLNDNYFIGFYDTQKKEYIYPTDALWATVNNTFPAITGTETEKTTVENYERTIYGKVPVYDLIVQPTYTSLDRVMYDEDMSDKSKQDYYVATNQIEFEITLSNGLQYSKRFEFDLDANYQTVVYLRISRERVDYNSSGSDLWVETTGYDDWYGVNNQNGNTLSFAGSSWQRAYTFGKTFTEMVTDGHYYYQDDEDKYAQYVDDATWIEMFAQAYQGGAHHGDYFILEHDISIPASALPDNYVFTGHLDGQDHTITLTGISFEREKTAAYDEDTYELYDNAGDTKYVKTGETSYEVFNPDETTYYSLGKDELNNEVYTAIANMADFSGSSIYERSGEDPAYTYTEIKLYKKVIVHHNAVMETVNRGFLFAGLNGKYSTAQESDVSATWEANVHKESGKWVPYKSETDGWRAEIINTNISGGTLFPSTAVYGTDVTGYVHNCWINGTFSGTPPKWSGTRVQDYTPSLPEY